MFRKLILWLLSTCLLILLTIGIVLWHTRAIALDEVFWKNEIHSYAVVSSLYDELATQVVKKQQELIPAESPLTFTYDEIYSLLDALFPSAWLEAQIDLTLDSISSWLRSDAPEYDVAFDISVQKATFSEKIKSRIKAKEESIPLCTAAETRAMQASEQTFSFTCLPPGFTLDQLAGPQGYEFFDNFPKIMPEQLTLRALLEGTVFVFPENLDPPLPPQPPPDVENYQNFMSGLRNARQVLRWIDLGFTLWLIVIAGLWALIVALVWRRPTAFLGRLGYIFFWLGILLSVLSWSLNWGAGQLNEKILSAVGSNLSPQLMAAAIGIPKDLAGRFISPLVSWGGAALTLGLLSYAVLIAMALERRKTRKRAKQADTINAPPASVQYSDGPAPGSPPAP
ncbi:hypothetical protein AUK40_00220 [Candidatus Wirthbacteria bacterium CG2_30_54_11]|uniref:Uncharacterized protein n=1 Tax=Candidatus Wirthbacteria bacterium CG2_30_54_11 TaxID=1817892 RepID=A0A1J5IT86_9BACT|nr:MAG: hypothetical protein AUK40_00220 [Candidatus Wirthbacteria bacterium CG2_30_54_11]